MKKMTYFLLILFGPLVSSCEYGASTEETKQYDTLVDIFQKSENLLIQYRKMKAEGGKDSLNLQDYTYETFKSESPELLNNTQKYKEGLWRLLIDDDIQKDAYTNEDIALLLFNLGSKDFLESKEKVFAYYKEDKVDFGLLKMMLMPNGKIKGFKDDSDIMQETEKFNQKVSRHLAKGNQEERELAEFLSNR
ncbi:hypothetical protein [Sphingobacterium sp. CZ-2]|uniref:hypothetical protein n=1 Tax=Sphingobacterium sp. CZ-2 TaxID=2557994 RepID=UPI00106F71AB|nr:hypothetical protein [Sphingobacterium sp. CZ-2]QBR13285.1 hypothetical protein E3D81_14360 [Sphingobacterium sp. CZ-2]